MARHQPLTCWRAKDRHLSAGWKHSKAPQPLTNWKAKGKYCQQAGNIARHRRHSQTEESRTGIVSRVETQKCTTATHSLKRQGQALSAGQNTERHHSHSLPGKPRTGIVSRLETQQGTTVTHPPENQSQVLSASQKHSKTPQPLTDWRAKNRHCQQARNTARHHNHSHAGEPRTGNVRRLETQRGTTDTLLRSDYTTYADTSDCLVFFILTPFTVAHVRYDLATCLWCFMYDTIWRLRL